MKTKDRGLVHWILRRFKAAPAQSMVEFAIALPVLLLLTFGVIEFGRLLQAWLALENGARFGARYAITGEYNKAYCGAAGAALGYAAEDAADGEVDCKVTVADPATATDAEKETARDHTQELQDWARMPSIRDAALAGASGIALDESVSGDYLQYLVDAETHGTTFSADYRGDPSQPGFFMISICSNRVGEPLPGVSPATFPVFLINDPVLDPSLARYYPGHDGQDEYQYFPTLCMAYNKVENGTNPDGSKKYLTVPQYYMDDAGGPGDRVRVTLTYRHPMIMPLLSAWWPTLRLNTSRDGVVEKFRTSRVTGLSEGNMNPDTPTYTSTQTATFTDTPTVTDTFTPSATFTNTATFTPTSTFTATATSTNTATRTATATNTATLAACPSSGNGLRAEYYNWTGGAPPANPFSTSPLVVQIVPKVDYYWNNSPVAGIGDNYFAIRFVGEVMPLASEEYTFYIATDDGGRLWVNNQLLVNRWQNQSETERSGKITLTRCQRYPIVFEMYENTGGAAARLRWSSASQVKEIIPQVNLFGELTSGPNTATFTSTNTRTATNTITNTPTITQTPSRTLTPSITLTPSRTFTRTATFTRTNTRTVTRTPTISNTPTITNTVPATNTYTRTPTRTSTRTNTPTNTNTVTNTPAPSNTFTRTPTRTNTGSPTPTNTPKGIGG
ncbi:hypothetical protein hrd7_07820 [Leptolinea sp. HRD-7]|nr:hypothetical protein hrd7_07820 [Leptolinea sp. HRD-7]